jgi:hypothetical protein
MARNCALDFVQVQDPGQLRVRGTIETPISAEERKAHG